MVAERSKTEGCRLVPGSGSGGETKSVVGSRFAGDAFNRVPDHPIPVVDGAKRLFPMLAHIETDDREAEGNEKHITDVVTGGALAGFGFRKSRHGLPPFGGWSVNKRAARTGPV
jgi:hypothetical protein